ncbi:MAG: hypothetical protein DRI57_33510 [Deltaproteobacteria bacterium]|nr:MAG: hypothetical protein DRI57_33510 [Deltaproteobacteria bacterium]
MFASECFSNPAFLASGKAGFVLSLAGRGLQPRPKCLPMTDSECFGRQRMFASECFSNPAFLASGKAGFVLYTAFRF